jgi:YggT family protein
MAQFLVVLVQAIEVYKMVLIARILLTWLPSINWYNQPFKLLRDITDPVLGPFRRMIPPVGMIDISPMALFLALSLIEMAIQAVLGNMAMSPGAF